MKPIALAVLLALGVLPAGAQVSTSLNPPVTPNDIVTAVASAAPVKTVNGATGNVLVPAYQRQVSVALSVSTTDGSVTWTFPTPFTNMPTCWPSLAATSTSFVFDYPVQGAIGLNSVSFSVSAHPKSLSIASLALPIVLQLTPNAPPAGTTLTLSCLAPL